MNCLELDPKIIIKSGVVMFGVKPEMIAIANSVCGFFEIYRHQCWITGAREGKHGKGSLHYKGYALDFRKWVVPMEKRKDFAFRLQEFLRQVPRLQCENRIIQVVHEKTHFHVELDVEK